MKLPRRRFIRLPFGLGTLVYDPGQPVIPADLLFSTHLYATVIDRGRIVDRFDLGAGVVTTAGVNLMAQDWSNTTATLKAMNYHQSGTGTNAPAIGNTALQTAITGNVTAGTQSNPTAGQYQTVATLSYSSSYAVTEWGLFNSSSGSGTATMWDRRTFSAINVSSTVQIQFTYQLTINAGG